MCDLQDKKKGQLVGTGRKVGPLFELSSLQVPSLSSVQIFTLSISSSLWHSCLGHTSLSHIQSSAFNGYSEKVNFDAFDCVSRQLGKNKALSFNHSDSLFHPF